jgi:molybdopterin converting factor small subunit
MPQDSIIAVRVKFMGDLPAVTGQRNIVVNLPEGSSVGDLLWSLSKIYGDPFRCRVFSGPATLHHYMVVFVGGKNMKEIGGFAAKLGDSDVEVVMLPMFEGG